MHRVSHRSVVRSLLIAGALIAATTGVAASHDFWIVPVSFVTPPGTPLEVRGQTGTAFPQSVSAVPADRIAEARLIDAGREERLTDFSIAGKSLLVRHRPTTPGQRVVALALVPRVSSQSAPGFERYLRLEGAAAVADAYQRSGGLPKDSVQMRVTKTAKTILEVGTRGPRAFSRPAGHELEIVPVTDPATARAGDTLALRILFRGQPLHEAAVVAGWAPYGASWEGVAPSPTASGTAAPPERQETRVTADSAGVVRVALDREGLWNARLVNAAPSADGSGADWDVYFATLVVGIGAQPTAGARLPAKGDTSSTSKRHHQ